MDLSLDEGQDSPLLPVHPAAAAVPKPHLEVCRTNKKSLFSISEVTEPLEEESNKSPADTFRRSLHQSERAGPSSLKRNIDGSFKEDGQSAQRTRDKVTDKGGTFKVPASLRPNESLYRVYDSEGSGGSAGPSLVRKFPGPAGLVNPARPSRPGDKRRVPADPGEREDRQEEVQEEEEEGGDLAECVTWRKATEELRSLGNQQEVLRFNTGWIRGQAEGEAGRGFKVPFFLGKIVQLDTTHRDTRVVLIDVQGKIDGSIHRDVLENYGVDIRPGTVLLVMKATVLTTVRKTCINITLNNLVAIYSQQQEVLSHQQLSADQMRVTAAEVERQRREEAQELEREKENSPGYSPAMTPGSSVLNSKDRGKSHYPAFSPMMLTPSPSTSNLAAPSPVMTSQTRNHPPLHQPESPASPAVSHILQSCRPTPGLPPLQLSPPSPSYSPPARPHHTTQPPAGTGKSKFVFKSRSKSNLVPPSSSSGVPPPNLTTRTSQLEPQPGGSQQLLSSLLSRPASSQQLLSSLLSEPEPAASQQQLCPSLRSEPEPAASQQLLSSLLSDLDTSDIWADF